MAFTEPEPEVPPVLENDLAALDQTSGKRGGYRKLWALCLGGLLVIGLLQVVYVWRDQVRAMSPFAERLVVEMCAKIPCTDAAATADAITLSARDVREHPRYQNALLVNATLLNKGPTAVPFPTLELRLLDDLGRLLGVRRFAPAQYLDESIDAAAGINLGQPVYVVLELDGNAVTAVSFEFRFL